MASPLDEALARLDQAVARLEAACAGLSRAQHGARPAPEAERARRQQAAGRPPSGETQGASLASFGRKTNEKGKE